MLSADSWLQVNHQKFHCKVIYSQTLTASPRQLYQHHITQENVVNSFYTRINTKHRLSGYSCTKRKCNKKRYRSECRHDMRPFIQLPSLSGDSKFGLTMVRPSLHSAPEPPALEPPPISKHVGLRQICGIGNFFRLLTSAVTLLFELQLKIGIPLTSALRNVYTDFDFSTFFLFSTWQTGGQADWKDA